MLPNASFRCSSVGMHIGMFTPDLGYDAEHRSQVEVFKVFLTLTQIGPKSLV
jgi:hypothetical protein